MVNDVIVIIMGMDSNYEYNFYLDLTQIGDLNITLKAMVLVCHGCLWHN